MIAPKATIYIECAEALESVAKRLQASLDLPEFWFKSDQDYPHAITAMSESLGHEIWLRDIGKKNHPLYMMTIEASMDVRDRMEASMVDVSEWLSKHVSLVSGLPCSLKNPNEKTA